jgi:hypothetical protein
VLEIIVSMIYGEVLLLINVLAISLMAAVDPQMESTISTLS